MNSFPGLRQAIMKKVRSELRPGSDEVLAWLPSQGVFRGHTSILNMEILPSITFPVSVSLSEEVNRGLCGFWLLCVLRTASPKCPWPDPTPPG